MRGLPGAVFVLDTRIEKIAVQEATRLEIPVIAIIETRWPLLEGTFAMKPKRIAGVTRSYLQRMKDYFSTFERHISLSRSMPSQNGILEI